MTNNAKKFVDCLKDASQLLEDYPPVDFPDADLSPDLPSLKSFDLALFEEWSKFSTPEISKKPPIRIVQHLSCTGGTIICKCLAGMANVTLLSEVHPLSQLHVSPFPKFAPTDLTYLALKGKFPLFDELSEKIFKADIDVISKHAHQLGKYLVIREHSHSDYLVGDVSANASTIKKLLQDEHPLICILTVRHPIDSYLSLLTNEGWAGFTPTTFDEYCNRYLLFLDHNSDVPLYKYEDFVNDPDTELRRMCEALDLQFNEDYQDVFDLNLMSGDSGRSSNTIAKRERRKFDDNFNKEMSESSSYRELCERLGYDCLLND